MAPEDRETWTWASIAFALLMGILTLSEVLK